MSAHADDLARRVCRRCRSRSRPSIATAHDSGRRPAGRLPDRQWAPAERTEQSQVPRTHRDRPHRFRPRPAELLGGAHCIKRLSAHVGHSCLCRICASLAIKLAFDKGSASLACVDDLFHARRDLRALSPRLSGKVDPQHHDTAQNDCRHAGDLADALAEGKRLLDQHEQG
jgi:hypothetical protein